MKWLFGLLVFASVAVLTAAPAPLARKSHGRLSIAGSYDWTWGGTTTTVDFTSCGKYTSKFAGLPWTGCYRLSETHVEGGKALVVEIDEQRLARDGVTFEGTRYKTTLILVTENNEYVGTGHCTSCEEPNKPAFKATVNTRLSRKR